MYCRPIVSGDRDLDKDEIRRALHRAADQAADYLCGVERYPVLPRVAPGELAQRLPASPPLAAEPIDRVLDDWQELIVPALTHWNHPGVMSYFAITGSAPGVAAELLVAATNVNAMLWRTSPAATELEERVCDWLRQMIGLPPEFAGHINDTASMSTLLALAAARERAGLRVREQGMAGRPELPRLVVYASDQAHSSVDKAVITLGYGHDNLRRVATDRAFALDPAALERAIEQDLRAGALPLAVVATVGTTSTTSVDPVPEIAAVARRHGLWLHIVAAYAGSAAICPELRPAGLALGDSIVVNPHKWLFVPVDCSVLWLRSPQVLRDAFALVPAYLQSSDGAMNLMDLGPQLGRRFRALKLWFVIRCFGVHGLQERIRHHCFLARRFASWLEQLPLFQVVAPVPYSTVCFRLAPPGWEDAASDRLNVELLARVNAAGPVLLSQTELRGRFVLRLAIGNLKTEERHVREAFLLLEAAARELLAAAEKPPP